jgi:predicted dehydrogenase
MTPNETTRAAMEEARDTQDDPWDVEMWRRTQDAKDAVIARLRKVVQAIAEQAEVVMTPEEMPEALDDIAAIARAALSDDFS